LIDPPQEHVVPIIWHYVFE